MKNKINLIIMTIALLPLIVSTCGYNTENNAIFYDDGTITVEGKNTITDTMTIPAGTIVTFKKRVKGYASSCEDFSMTPLEDYDYGKLVFENGGKLIAQGTENSPIQITTEDYIGSIYFNEDASEDSILEYCNIYQIDLTISKSINIRHNKFDCNYIEFKDNANAVFEYNTITLTGPSINYISCEESSAPLIRYNDINNTSRGIEIAYPSNPTVSYNNIHNLSSPAITYEYNDSGTTNYYQVDSNYIANCNGLTGVDTTGIQSSSVTYVNPQAVPVVNAGCGW